MNDQLPYGPDVYKRLDLVSKQFKRNSTDLKTQQAVEKRRLLVDILRQNEQMIIRRSVYVLLGLLIMAVVGVVLVDAFKG